MPILATAEVLSGRESTTPNRRAVDALVTKVGLSVATITFAVGIAAFTSGTAQAATWLPDGVSGDKYIDMGSTGIKWSGPNGVPTYLLESPSLSASKAGQISSDAEGAGNYKFVTNDSSGVVLKLKGDSVGDSNDWVLIKKVFQGRETGRGWINTASFYQRQ